MASEPPRKRIRTDYYSRDVDFDAIAKSDPNFATITTQGKKAGWIDFHDPKVVQQLTKSLLKYDFNLSLTLPPDRLCPPIPVRWNYIRWLQDLLDTTDPSAAYSETFNADREVLGLDIGVGASSIYGLLACASRAQWRMAGTDIDEYSLGFARGNVEANGLEERVRVKKVRAEEELIPPGLDGLDFVMMNPPFYGSLEEFRASYNDPSEGQADTKAAKDGGEASTSPAAPASLVGAPNEMICPQGDVGFVTRLVNQSLKLRDKVQWYTAMLSHMHSLQSIITILKKSGITNYAVTSLHPGNKTKRYALGWSFDDFRPRNDVARHGELVLGVLPHATENTIRVPLQSAQSVGKKADEIVKKLDGKWAWRSLLDAGVFECKGNVWNRKARSRKKRGEEIVQQEGDADDTEVVEVALAVKISCKAEQIDVRWLRGQDDVLFMGFCKFLKDQLVGRHDSRPV